MDRRASFVSDATERHEQAVKRFRSLYDLHRVPFGRAEDLHGFVDRLKENRHLAMDFWGLVGDLSARERGPFSDEEMLSAVVEGASGHGVEDLPANAAEAANLLRQMLAGVDIGGPVLPDVITDPKDELLLADRDSLQKKSQPTEDRVDRTQTQRMITDALLKLEDTARELREHLAVIEREKPSAVPQTVVATQAVEDSVSKPTTEGSTEPVPLPQVPPAETKLPFSQSDKADTAALKEPVVEREPLVFAPRSLDRLLRRGLAPEEKADDDPSIVVPLAAYADANPRGKAIFLAAIVLLLLLAGGLWFAISRGYTHAWAEEYGPFVQRKLELFRQEIRDLREEKPAPAAEKPAPAPAQPSPAPATPQPPANAAPPPSTNPEVAADTNADSSPAPETPVPPPPTQPVPAAKDESNAQPATVIGGVPHVSYATMQAHLTSSRVPVYPERARAMRVEGTVVVEILVSKTGVVQRVHVLRGDSRLRMAAIDAVLRWRYKPYSQNGRPVAVITQAQVHFRLPGR